MARQDRIFYGWVDAVRGEIRVSKYPPDATVRPSIEMESIEAAKSFAERKRARLMWFPPLPVTQSARRF